MYKRQPLNHAHPGLDNVKVREAIDYAIDKQAIIEAVTFNLGEVANSYIPKGCLLYTSRCV